MSNSTEMSDKAIDSVLSGWDKREIATILSALSGVDPSDLDYLEGLLSDGGRGRYWKGILADFRNVFTNEG